MSKTKFGLRELEKDSRDFQLGAFTVLPDLDELPDSFELTTPFPIKNQGQTDFCSAYSSCAMSELQEGVELYPEYSFALGKEISGDPDTWGQNMRDALKAHQKYGAIEAEEALKQPKIDDLRRLNSYPDSYIQMAEKHRKQSYFKITGSNDHFNNIRASIWKYREQKQAVAIGCIWSWGNKYLLDSIQEQGYGHMVYITGWDEDGLVIVNSWGENAGKNGKHRMTREVVNAFAGRFGIMMMVDIPPEEVKKQLDRQEWYFASCFEKIKIFFRDLMKLWESQIK